MREIMMMSVLLLAPCGANAQQPPPVVVALPAADGLKLDQESVTDAAKCSIDEGGTDFYWITVEMFVSATTDRNVTVQVYNENFGEWGSASHFEFGVPRDTVTVLGSGKILFMYPILKSSDWGKAVKAGTATRVMVACQMKSTGEAPVLIAADCGFIDK